MDPNEYVLPVYFRTGSLARHGDCSDFSDAGLWPDAWRNVMKTIAMLVLSFGMAAASAGAVTMYRGQLVDASCYQQNSAGSGEKVWVTCAPTASTTAFAIHTDGKIRMLDAAGNDKAKAAFQQGLLKRDANTDMPVVIDGYRHGNTIQVEGIRARGAETSVH